MSEIEYRDVIHHRTTTKFPLWQRIKHLFGAPVIIESQLKCEHIPGAILAEARGVHTPIFRLRKRNLTLRLLTDEDKLEILVQTGKVDCFQMDSIMSMLRSPDPADRDFARMTMEEIEKRKFGFLERRKNKRSHK